MSGEEVRSVSSTGGEKGVKLARFDLVPVGPLTQLAEHYGRGAQKYADNQWRKGYEWSKSYAALTRHLTAFWGGEDIDSETGSPHMAAVAWHAFALLEFMQTHPDFDDRHRVTVEVLDEPVAEDAEVVEAEVVPREWAHPGLVPHDVKVVDNDGDTWFNVDGLWYWRDADYDTVDRVGANCLEDWSASGPFKEILNG